MLSPFRKPQWLLALVGLTSFAPASAERILTSGSLNTCQKDSQFEASLFNVRFNGDTGRAEIEMRATSSVQGYVMFDVEASAYGYEFLRETVNPCDINLPGMCPMPAAQELNSSFVIEAGTDIAIPGIAYTVPDLDATVRVRVNLTEPNQSVACVEVEISNGKTVDLLGVKWATAVIAGLGLVSSAIVSGLGHTNAAAHVAANSLSLFTYFQAQAIIGLTGVPLPPIVQSWTNDFQWSMGIIHVGWMQDIFTWYQRATGGEPATIFQETDLKSVQVMRRDLVDYSYKMVRRGLELVPQSLTKRDIFSKRANIENESGGYLVYGIQRVAYETGIETTNLFLTGLTFFCLFVLFTIIIVALVWGIIELSVRQKWISNDKFLEFRNGSITILKGILFRCTLLGLPQIVILCLWEFTQVDSPALVVLAVFFLLGMIGTLAWGASKVIRIARRSVAMHRNPAYILFSDPQALNKWGFLYIQFRASAYYFILPLIGYIIVKGMFVGLAQSSGITQAVAFIVLEAAFLIGASVMRPWMDKPTNSFNIAIGSVNFVNAIFLLIFTNVFDMPAIVVGVVGVVLFVLNAAFSLILLIMVIVSTSIILWRKNPDARYQVMADDRTSFMKSQTQLNTTTELDALAATARGDKAGYKSQLDLDDDNESLSSDDMRRRAEQTNGVFGLAPGASQSQVSFHNPPRSPVNPSMPLFPAGQRPESPFRSASPSPFNRSGSALGQSRSPPPAQGGPTSSPWQRGAGYDH